MVPFSFFLSFLFHFYVFQSTIILGTGKGLGYSLYSDYKIYYYILLIRLLWKCCYRVYNWHVHFLVNSWMYHHVYYVNLWVILVFKAVLDNPR